MDLQASFRRIPAHLAASPGTGALAAVSGLVAGVAIGLPLSRGHFGAVLIMALFAAALAGVVRALVPPEHRAAMAKVLLLAIAARFAVAALLYFWAEAIDRSSLFATVPLYYVVGDDSQYAEVSWGVIQWLQGNPDPRIVPISWHGNAYLLGSYVYLEMLVFWLFSPIVLNVQLVNAGLAGVLIVLVYDMARRLFGSRPALLASVATAFYPSLALWSTLGLKDSLGQVVIAGALWLFVRFQQRPRWLLLGVIFIALIPLETVRRYVYVGLAGIFPIAVLLTARLTAARRAGFTVAAGLLTFVLLSMGSGEGQGTYGIPTGFGTFEAIRTAMGEGARTTYADPRTVATEVGGTFVVVSGNATPESAPCGRLVIVPPGGRVVLSTGAPPTAEPGNPCEIEAVGAPPAIEAVGAPPAIEAVGAPPAIVVGAPPAIVGITYVQPGDIIVIGDASTRPAASPVPLVLTIGSLSSMADMMVAEGSPDALTMTRTLAYLPRGFAYAVLAPFPWDARRILDVLTIPEFFAWLVILGALSWSLWHERGSFRSILPIVLYVLGMFGVLTLTEGNWGTLFRHRAMITPFVLVLASPGLLALAGWLSRRGARSPRRS